MARRTFNPGSMAIVAVALALPATLAWPAGAGTRPLEELLRERRPEIASWQVQPLSSPAAGAEPAAIESVGRIGARTPVRHADGRVAWYAVAGYREVLVSARTIEGGAPLSAADARPESRDVLTLGCEPMAGLDATQRWRARRRLAAGEVLCDSTVEPAPDVERNRAVTLSASSGGIQVSRVLVAASDAHAGERVRLRDASGVTLIGIVTGPGAARVAGEKP